MAHFNTKAIHAGQIPDKETGAVIPPIYQTSTFAQEAPNEPFGSAQGRHNGFDYTRADNPNYRNLEEAIAALEQGKFATVFSSGVGASLGVLSSLKAGDHIVAGQDLYGGTYRLFTQWGEKFGLSFTFFDATDPKNLEKSVRPESRLVWLETPTNPLLRLTDIQAMTTIAKSKKLLVVVDNTFATPFCQRPLDSGVDLVLHSTTKYIGGHSDVIGGAVITREKDLKEKLDFARKALGVNPSPFDCWLMQRGVKTLGLRMERHLVNALTVANFLEKHPKVKKVHYPGLESHPQHSLARRQMTGFGGVVSAEFQFSIEKTKKLISSFGLFRLAESLGGVESLVSHPATMTHASIPAAERARAGLSDSLVRFSVGIEDSEDLLADLEEALSHF
ncbi:MAG: PLP-dependent aspartate aminotransferase family protein [Deltaproteobacteria bacterium]|nr:PLP-dependent aspartate aminotransferase family protein [Deltaproteobacteria bacterium]